MEGFIGSPRCGGVFSFSGRSSGDHLVDWALGYADAEDHVIGGSLLDTGCPNEAEPQETSLSVGLS